MIDAAHLLHDAWPEPFSVHLFHCRSAYISALGWILHELEQGTCQRLHISRWEEEPRLFMLQDFRRPTNGGSDDRQAVKHALENHHSKGLVPAWHDQDISPLIPFLGFISSKPAHEGNLAAVRCEGGREPPAFHLCPATMPVAADQDEARGWGSCQHQGDCGQQISNALSLHKSTNVEHLQLLTSPVFSPRPVSLAIVSNTIAHDPHPVAYPRAVLDEQLLLISRERNHAIGRRNSRCLHFPLRQTLGRPLAEFVLSAIQRVDGVDKRRARPFLNGTGNRPEPKGMQVEDIRLPLLYQANTNFLRIIPGNRNDGHACWIGHSLHLIGRYLSCRDRLAISSKACLSNEQHLHGHSGAHGGGHQSADRRSEAAIDYWRKFCCQMEDPHP